MLAVCCASRRRGPAFASFADPIIFVFIGSFILAEAMFVHGVDRRIAYTALSWKFVGTSATRILIVFGGVTTLLSMWMSNTATTAMMFPIGLSIVAHLARSGAAGARQFAMVMMLITVVRRVDWRHGHAGRHAAEPDRHRHARALTGVDITFFQWMVIGVPPWLLMFACVALQFHFVGRPAVTVGAESTQMVRDELAKLGPLSRGQRNVLIAFGLTVVLWIAPGVVRDCRSRRVAVCARLRPGDARERRGDDRRAAAVRAAGGLAGRRFTLTWEQALKIDWGIVLLYGGGLAMGELAFSTGLAEAMGKGITAWLPSQSTVALTMLFTGVAIVLSEATSNTAAANMIVPIAIAVAQAAGVRPLEPALGATLGASMGFMMPVSTPPNAIVYSSGFIPITAMMRYGLFLDVAGFVVIVALVLLLGPMVF